MNIRGKFANLSAAAAACADAIYEQKRHVVPFAILMGIFLAFYLGELSTFTISVDEEFAAVRTDPIVWIYQGRWMLYLIELAISQPIVPYFPILFFGLFYSASYLLVLKSFRYDSRSPVVFLTFLLFTSFPTLFFIVDFAGNLPGIAVGTFLACFAIFVFSRVIDSSQHGIARSLSKAALQVVAAAAAIACYQSYTMFVLFGCCAVLATALAADQKISVKKVAYWNLYIFVIVTLSASISHLVTTCLIYATGGNANYISNFNALWRLISMPGEVIFAALREYAAVYLGDSSVFGNNYYSFVALILFGILSIVFQSRDKRFGSRVFLAVYLVGMTFIPFLFNLVAGGHMPYRTLVAMPLVFWFFASAAAFTRSRAVQVVVLGLCAVVALQSLYVLSTFQASRRLAYQHDVQLASSIYDRMALEAEAFDRVKPYQLEVFGGVEFKTIYPKIGQSTWSASLFEWDGGNVNRMVTFMNLLGMSNLHVVTLAQRAELLPEMLGMPVWPQRGSLKVIGNTVLLRLGEKPGVAHRDLMGKFDRPGQVLFEMVSAPEGAVWVRNADIVSRGPAQLRLAARNDPMVMLNVGRPEEMRDCRVLRASMKVAGPANETAQMFFLPTNSKEYGQASSALTAVEQGAPAAFTVISMAGFADEIRIDPIAGAGDVTVSDLSIRCLVKRDP